MKFCLFNDLHLEFSSFEFPPEDTYDVMIWAGDIYPIQQWLEDLTNIGKGHTKNIPRNKPIYYVMGNHEYYHTQLNEDPLRDYLAKEFPNITVLENECVELDSCFLYGMTMWTNFDDRHETNMSYAQRRMNDYRYIYLPDASYEAGMARIPITPHYIANIHDKSMIRAHDAMIELKKILESYKGIPTIPDKKIIMVTHHSPAPSANPRLTDDPKLNSAYVARDAGKLIGEFNIDVWCHGHTHEVRDEMVAYMGDLYDMEQPMGVIRKCTRVLSNARGYAGHNEVEGFNPNGIIFEVRSSYSMPKRPKVHAPHDD